MTSTPTRPVGNVVITTKGLQDRNIHIIDGTTVENKGKLILSKYHVHKLPSGAVSLQRILRIIYKKGNL